MSSMRVVLSVIVALIYLQVVVKSWSAAREPDDACCARAARFLEWLSRRPEKRIAVVTHSSFLRHLLMQFGDGLSPADAEALRAPVGNCELRSVVLCSHGALEAEDREEEEGAVA